MKKYIVELTGEERKELERILKAERMAAHKPKHAQMLRKADQESAAPGATVAEKKCTEGVTS